MTNVNQKTSLEERINESLIKWTCIGGGLGLISGGTGSMRIPVSSAEYLIALSAWVIGMPVLGGTVDTAYHYTYSQQPLSESAKNGYGYWGAYGLVGGLSYVAGIALMQTAKHYFIR